MARGTESPRTTERAFGTRRPAAATTDEPSTFGRTTIVFYADQGHRHGRPEDAAATIDRIVQTIPIDDLHGEEWYLTDWS